MGGLHYMDGGVAMALSVQGKPCLPPLAVLEGMGKEEVAWVGPLVVTAALALQALSPSVLRYALRPRKCKNCCGVGNNLCASCKGRGKQGGLFTGEILEKCHMCGGNGRQLCTKCVGTGLANRWLYKPVGRRLEGK